MADKIVEPSEILIDGEGTVRDDPIRANPWLRFFGRMFDYSIWCLALLALKKAGGSWMPKGNLDALIPYEYIAWIPLEAALLHFWGLTPGKWLVGAEIVCGKEKKLDFPSALRRSFNVWFRGFGLGIVGINALAMLIAYQRLRLMKETSWDRDERIRFTHRPVSHWRVYLCGIVALGGLAAYQFLKTS